MTTNEGGLIVAPKPLRIPPNLVNPLDDMSQPWTRSPTKSKMEPVLATWQFISSDHPGTGNLQLVYAFSHWKLNNCPFWYFCYVVVLFLCLRLVCTNSCLEKITDPSSRDSLQLAPMPDSYDLDRGLLLSVQAIQVHIVNFV